MDNIEIGPQVPQRELKGYSKTTEVIIPILQSLTVMAAVDVLAGLLAYLAVFIGPTWLQVTLGLLLFLGTVVVVSQIESQRRRVGLIVGGSLLAAQQGLLMQARAVWPWEWVTGEFWWAWVYTCWLGPLLGCAVLIWRFVNEVRDPWWPRPQVTSEEPKTEVVTKDRPIYISRWSPKGSDNEQSEQPRSLPEPTPVYSLGDDLRAFVVEAHRRGLERSNWIKPNTDRIRLWPSGRAVTRGYYDQLVNILRQADLVTWSGSGSAVEWSCTLKETLDCIEDYREGRQAAGGQET